MKGLLKKLEAFNKKTVKVMLILAMAFAVIMPNMGVNVMAEGEEQASAGVRDKLRSLGDVVYYNADYKIFLVNRIDELQMITSDGEVTQSDFTSSTIDNNPGEGFEFALKTTVGDFYVDMDGSDVTKIVFINVQAHLEFEFLPMNDSKAGELIPGFYPYYADASGEIRLECDETSAVLKSKDEDSWSVASTITKNTSIVKMDDNTYFGVVENNNTLVAEKSYIPFKVIKNEDGLMRVILLVVPNPIALSPMVEQQSFILKHNADGSYSVLGVSVPEGMSLHVGVVYQEVVDGMPGGAADAYAEIGVLMGQSVGKSGPCKALNTEIFECIDITDLESFSISSDGCPDAGIIVSVTDGNPFENLEEGVTTYYSFTLGMCKNPALGEYETNSLSAAEITGVSLNKESTTIEVGSSETIVATVSPSDAKDKTVVWISDDESIATVDKDGKVTAVATGTTTITAITLDGAKTATCSITVKAKSNPTPQPEPTPETPSRPIYKAPNTSVR